MRADPPPRGVRERLLRGTISNYVGKFASVATWFLLTPLILREVGPVGYGLWVLVGSIASYGYLLDFGVGGAVVKYVAQHTATGESELATRLLATAFRLYLVLGAAAVAATALLASVFPHLFDISAGQRATVGWMILLTGVTVGITIAFTPAVCVLQAKHRYDLYNLVNAGGSLLTAVATVGVLAAGWGVLGMVAATVPVTLLMRVIAIRLARRAAPELRFGLRGADRRLLRRILAFSSSSFAMFLSSRFSSKTDEFVIAAFLPLGAVAPYALARKLGELAQLVAEQLVKTLMPIASELDTRNERERLRLLYVVGTRLTLAVFIPVALALVVLAGPILTAWVGPEYEGSAILVIILTLSGLVGTSQWSAQSILEGMARHRLVALAMLAGGVANVALSVVLVRSLGLVGVALGTLIPTVVVSLGVILPFAVRVLRIGAVESLRGIWLPALLPALPSGAVLLALRHLLSPSSAVTILLLAGAGAVVYGAAYLSFGVTRMERATLRQAIRSTRALAVGLRAG